MIKNLGAENGISVERLIEMDCLEVQQPPSCLPETKTRVNRFGIAVLPGCELFFPGTGADATVLTTRVTSRLERTGRDLYDTMT